MSVRMTGAEFKAFYADESVWLDGRWHEDESITVNGIELDPGADLTTLPGGDAAVVVIKDGCVFTAAGDDLGTFEGFARKWKKAQLELGVAAVIPRDKRDEFVRMVKQLGGQVTL